ncbi:hypothetical protein B9Z55_011478 [Caenorhabditis nigoni]|nr:hypothetical protein B9Z55_011478 [Caenorhabditis nigoni]
MMNPPTMMPPRGSRRNIDEVMCRAAAHAKKEEFFKQGGFEFQSLAGHILESSCKHSKEIQEPNCLKCKYDTELELDELPEMVFARNCLRIHFQSAGFIEFNTLDALKMVISDRLPDVQVGASSAWQSSRKDRIQQIQNHQKPFDWTFTTHYKGTVNGLKLRLESSGALGAEDLGAEALGAGTGSYDPEAGIGAAGTRAGGGGIGALRSGALGGGQIGGSEQAEVESEDRSWWRWNRRIGAGGGEIGGSGAGGGGIGGSELVEVESELVELESEDRSTWRWNQRIGGWWRWNQRIGGGGIGGSGAGGGGIGGSGAGGGGIGGSGAGGGGIGGSEMVEVESEERSWWRWNRRIGDGGGGIGGSELVEVESEDRSWWKWIRSIGAGGGGIGGSELMEVTPTTERIDMERLKRRDAIAFSSSVILFEDELADHGIAQLSARCRVMREGYFFVLLRFYMRVDGVLLRCCDTRIVGDDNSGKVIREWQLREAKYENLRHVDPEALLDVDRAWMHLPIVEEQIDCVSVD